jgi:hypothetical protein
MMKNWLTFWLIASIGICKAQGPNWSLNENDYQFSMTITTVLNLNGTTLSNANDKVGAFINNEVRGVAKVVYNASRAKYVAYLTVFSNVNSEIISFKIYDSTADEVINVNATITFQIDGNVGTAFQSLSLANPPLSDEARLTSFSFDGVATNSIQILENSVNVELSENTNVNDLVANFTTSNNSNVYVDRVKQTSGVTTQNYTNPITFLILSEDESVTKEYQINVAVETVISDLNITLSATQTGLVINKVATIDVQTSEEIKILERDDFSFQNAVLQSINKINARSYTVSIVALNQGDFSVQIPQNSVETLNDKGNNTSNALIFSLDNVKPFLSSVIRKTPITEITNANSVSFSVVFSEAVNNVSADDFETVTGGNISLQMESNTTYTVTVSNVDTLNGTVFISTKSTTNIVDLAGNTLRTSILKTH